VLPPELHWLLRNRLQAWVGLDAAEKTVVLAIKELEHAADQQAVILISRAIVPLGHSRCMLEAHGASWK
jgi:hypothetical protein